MKYPEINLKYNVECNLSKIRGKKNSYCIIKTHKKYVREIM